MIRPSEGTGGIFLLLVAFVEYMPSSLLHSVAFVADSAGI